MIHESGFITLSIHKTLEGAENAIDSHRKKMRKEWEDNYNEEERKEFPFGEYESWAIDDEFVRP